MDGRRKYRGDQDTVGEVRTSPVTEEGDGSIAVSIVDDPGQSYTTGMSSILDSFDATENGTVSFYGREGRFVRIRVLDSPEDRSVMDMLPV